MRYNVDDRVTIRNDLRIIREIHGVIVTPQMKDMAGQVMTISKAYVAYGDIKMLSRYRLKEDKWQWCWIDDFFEEPYEEIDDVDLEEMLFGVM